MAKRISHQQLAAELIKYGAIDSQVSEDSYAQNEVDNILDRHKKAGLPVESYTEAVRINGQMVTVTRYYAPHDAFQHCPLCCEWDICADAE